MAKPILIPIKNKTREEWLELRRKGIGGSDIAAILGLNPYRSAIDVWLDKTGRAEEREASEAMRQGTDLEQYVADRFCEATGKKCRRVNFMYQHPEHPYLLANIDRDIVGEDALLECKTTSVYSADRWEDGEIPDEYFLQVQYYLGITGAAKAYIACVIFNREFIWREIERDDAIIQSLFDEVGEFWRSYVEADEMPPPDGSKAAGKALADIYSADPGIEAIELRGFDEQIARYDQISALISDLEAEREQIKQSIQAEMKNADTAYIGARKIAMKEQRKTTIDAKRLKEEDPETYEQYVRIGEPFRVFRPGKAQEID